MEYKVVKVARMWREVERERDERRVHWREIERARAIMREGGEWGLKVILPGMPPYE